jgi:hypothetical protein
MKNSLRATLHYTTTSETLPPTHITITLSLSPSLPHQPSPQKKSLFTMGQDAEIIHTLTSKKKKRERIREEWRVMRS